MPNKQPKIADMLSSALLIVVILILVGCSIVFIKGQIDANRAIVDAGKAINASLNAGGSSQTVVDYTAAITYMEAAQQTYSENSVMKITSLIYALLSSVILGYGAKVLRLGTSDKQELCKELLEKTAQQFNESSNQMLLQQNDIYIAVTTCETVAQLALLLRSYFDLIKNNGNGSPVTANSDIAERLQIELTYSLKQFEDFLACSENNENKLTKDQLEMIKRSWGQTKRAITEYVFPSNGASNSCLEAFFGKYDQKAVADLVEQIERLMVV